MERNICFSILLTVVFVFAQAQNTPQERYEVFKRQTRQQYEDFRAEANRQYAEFLKQAWKNYKASTPLPRPKDENIKPVIYDEEQYRIYRQRKPRLKDGEREYEDNRDGYDNKIVVRRGKDGKEVIVDDDGKDRDEEERKKREIEENDNREIVIDDIITPPRPLPQPTPVSPIREIEDQKDFISVDFYGLSCNIRLDTDNRFKLRDISNESISKAWEQLSGILTNNAIRDLLEMRIRYDLCDWAYLLLISQVAETYCGVNTNEAVLLTAYLFCQSGYKMRLATDGAKLYMLYNSLHTVYDVLYWNIDGEIYYVFGDINADELQLCDFAYPGEQPLSFVINKEQKIGKDFSDTRNLKSSKYPMANAFVSENKILMKFFSTYPTSKFGDNDVSRWALYAGTPINSETRKQLYPTLQQAIVGKSKLEQVSILLNWVQTAFVYEYDDKVWGGDRAFFPDETLYYPYCDCEDRSILFSVLVRDLVGLKVALVFYPGHLATAVCFDNNVNGDYIIIGGKKYIIADPTYIGADVGQTMMGMDNKTAKVIVLNNLNN